MSITLFVGDNNQELADTAKNYDSTAFLVDNKNYKKFLESDHSNQITGYTSSADLPKITDNRSIFFDVLSKADKIFYCPPVKWSDATKEFSWNSQQRFTEYYLNCINLEKNNVHGLDLTPYAHSSYLDLVETRQTDNPCLWITGCSSSLGVGVELNQRYGQLIADKIGYPVYHLTERGASIEWSADQILRSDIRKGDIVVWGLTTEFRGPRALNGKVVRENNPDALLSETRLYKAITSVHQVVNFCRAVGCQLVMFPIITSENLQLMLHSVEEYIQLPYHIGYLDLGNDGIHGGTLQHLTWANHVLKRIL